MCANDCEERNYTLGRDAHTLSESIRQLQGLLVKEIDFPLRWRRVFLINS